MAIKLSNYISRVCDRLTNGDNSCPQRPIIPNPHIDFYRFAEYLISRGKSERTTKEYLYKIHDFKSDVNPQSLQNFYEHIHFQTKYVNKVSQRTKGEFKVSSPETIKRKNYMIYNCLRLYVLSLGKREWLEHLPHKSEIDNPIIKTKKVILREGELKLLINNSDPAYKLLFEILNCTGMRISETLFMRKEWVKWGLNPVEIVIPSDITKGKKESSVFINQKVVKLLKNYTKNMIKDDFLFIFLKDEFDKINKNRKKNFIKTYIYIEHEQLHILFKMREFAPERIKNSVSPHWFRHNFAQILHQNNINLLEIQGLMRHSSPLLTSGYINIGKEKMKEAYKKSEKLFD